MADVPGLVERAAFKVFESYWPDASAQWIREHWATDWKRCRTVERYKVEVVLAALADDAGLHAQFRAAFDERLTEKMRCPCTGCFAVDAQSVLRDAAKGTPT